MHLWGHITPTLHCSSGQWPLTGPEEEAGTVTRAWKSPGKPLPWVTAGCDKPQAENPPNYPWVSHLEGLSRPVPRAESEPGDRIRKLGRVSITHQWLVEDALHVKAGMGL